MKYAAEVNPTTQRKARVGVGVAVIAAPFVRGRLVGRFAWLTNGGAPDGQQAENCPAAATRFVW
jgi:hypothetical protein